MNLTAFLAMLWPLAGAAQAVLTGRNLLAFSPGTTAPPVSSEEAPPAPPAAPSPPRNLGARPSEDSATDSERLVSLLVPARQEASRIGACVSALLAQTHADIEVLVLDDGSDDGTAEAASAAAAGDTRFRLLAGGPPEAGWTGKTWACQQLFEASRGYWICFLEADVLLAPEAIATAVAIAREQGSGLLSWSPRVTPHTPMGAAILPMRPFLLLSSLPLAWAEGLPPAGLAAADSAFLMFTRREYTRAGGHQACASHFSDAVALASAVKAGGGKVVLRDAEGHLTRQTEEAPKALWEQHCRHLFPLSGGHPQAYAAGVAGYAVLHGLPAIAVLLGLLLHWPGLTSAGLLQLAIGVGVRLALALRLKQPLWSPLLHPLASGFMVAAAIASWYVWTRKGLLWKGRPCGGSNQTPPAPEAKAAH
ncbi:MAG: glycosyltransferase [Candidatus Sericytochromatia bacterium]|nr:glycosyltransferase [Candidatus Sericytochromatia bacterium]